MKNQEMKTIQDHTGRKENCYKNNQLGNEMAATSTTKDNGVDEDVYVNVEELKTGTELSNSVKKNETPTTKKESANKSTKPWIILAALILLIIMFLILVVFTSLLLKYYLEMNDKMSQLNNHDLEISKEVSQLKNHADDQQQVVLEGVKTFRKDLDDVKEHFLQDIKAINKTIETICRTCPPGWQPIGLFCYYTSTDRLSWDNARDDCIRKGSGLVMLKTSEEMDALKSIGAKSSYWIGSYRDTENSNWKWLDGSVMSFSTWKKGEPNNHGGKEDCLEAWIGNWNDRTCSDTMKYICKKMSGKPPNCPA